MNYPFCNPSMDLSDNHRMKISGAGTVKATPDIAVANLGVVTQNMSLQAAQEENTQKSAAVINSFLKSGIPQKDISTTLYTVEPQYDYIEGKQIFRGYSITHILSVRITDVSKTGAIIDSATASGANRVDSIRFEVSNPDKYYNRALNLALKNAIQKADIIGQTLGVDVADIPIKIVETGYPAAAEEGAMVKFAAVAATPILPGQQDITARIEATFVYTD